MEEEVEQLLEDITERMLNSLESSNSEESLIDMLSSIDDISPKLKEFLTRKGYNDNSNRMLHVNDIIGSFNMIINVTKKNHARLKAVEDRIDNLYVIIKNLKHRKFMSFLYLFIFAALGFSVIYVMNPAAAGAILDFLRALGYITHFTD